MLFTAQQQLKHPGVLTLDGGNSEDAALFLAVGALFVQVCSAQGQKHLKSGVTVVKHGVVQGVMTLKVLAVGVGSVE